MSYQISYCHDNKIVVITVKEELTYDLTNQILMEAGRLANSRRISLLLCDCRNAPARSSILEVYGFPTLLERAGITRLFRNAFIVSQDLEYYRFIETISLNRGYQVHLFDDMDNAISWLTESPNKT